MSKRAEEAALKAYPELERFSGLSFYDPNSNDRAVFKQGYEQAEKDLALTWEDIRTITSLGFEVVGLPEVEHYSEILSRFNEQRKK